MLVCALKEQKRWSKFRYLIFAKKNFFVRVLYNYFRFLSLLLYGDILSLPLSTLQIESVIIP